MGIGNNLFKPCATLKSICEIEEQRWRGKGQDRQLQVTTLFSRAQGETSQQWTDDSGQA